MKTIALIWFIAAVVQMTLSAPASGDSPEEVIERAQYFIKLKYHKYDDKVADYAAVLKSMIEKLDDIIANDDDDTNTTEEIEIYELIKNHFTEFLEDLENETIIKECGAQLVGGYFYKTMLKSLNDVSENGKSLFDSFAKKLEEALPIVNSYKNQLRIFDDVLVLEELRKRAKLSTVCCKFSNKSDYDEVFDGEC